MAEQQKPAYKRQSYLNSVLESSHSRYAVRAILQHLCWISDFHQPFVKVTKAQIHEKLGYHRDTIIDALSQLRREGSIIPQHNSLRGGRGNAVTYRLCAAGQGGSSFNPNAGQGGPASPDPPENRQLDQETEGKPQTYGGKTFKQWASEVGAVKAIDICDRCGEDNDQ